jgi:hypothetical protein
MKHSVLFAFLILATAISAQEKLRIVPITDYTEFDYAELDSNLTIEKLFKDSIGCIELVSLKPYPSSRKGYFTETTIVRENGIDVSHLKTVLKLDTAKWEELSAILEIPAPEIDTETLCYMPRNGIILYSKSGVIISYLELCFECNMRRNSGIPLADPQINFSDEKYRKLKSFFNESGMKIYEPK